MKFIILLSCLFLFHTNIQAQEENNFLQTICYNTTNYTPGSQYHLNLIQLLTSLISNVTRDGFFHTKIGKVEGLVQCRGGLSTEQCQTCLNKSSVEIIQSCPSRKDALSRYDYCFLLYSSSSFSQVETTSRWSYMDAYNISDAYTVLYEQQYRKLMNHLSMAAASTILRFSYGHINFTTRNNIYGMAQCTQDLSRSACFSCLQRMVPRPDCCYRRRGGRIFGTNCFIRYELHEFLNAVLESNPPEITVSPPESSSNDTQITEKVNGKDDENTIKFVAVAVPVIGSATLIAICVFLMTKRRKPEEAIKYDQDDIRDEKSQQYDLDMIKRATNGFSILNKLGEGGFGAVYKGHFLNGQEIAVKRLSKNSGQGSEEFKNEVVLLLKLQHRNLVKLLGYCMEGEEKLLVYEYLPNRSLDYYIFDSANKTLLDWERRYKIIGGIARGLLYLHEDSRLRIIHRDLKSGNILLDKEMNPKIADFGLAKLFGVDETEGNTNRIAGTYGYMAPEYALHGFFSVKSDVYSFGVLLLEIVSGLKTKFFHFPGSPVDLLSHAWKLWRDGNALELIDPTLVGNYSTEEILRCIHIGLLCVQDKLDDRPNMSNVVLMLTSYSLILETPCVPTFNLESTMGYADTSSNLGSSSSTTGSLLYNLI